MSTTTQPAPLFLATSSPAIPPGKLISFEGIECAGKGVQIDLTNRWLTSHGLTCLVMREPGGSAYGEALRTLIKHPQIALPALDTAMQSHEDYRPFADLGARQDYQRSPACEAFIFLGARAEYSGLVQDHLQEGMWVISDRLHDSTVAYQGGGLYHSDPARLEQIRACNQMALDGLTIALTIFLDITVDEMLRRMRAHPDQSKHAFIEQREPAFFERARAQYHQIAIAEPERFKVIDGHGSPAEVFERIMPHFNQLIATN